MGDQPLDECCYRDMLDKILFGDPPGAMRQVSITNGISKQKHVVTFADGSQLIIASRQSTATRMIDMFSHILESNPEREKITCIACSGDGRCPGCNGRGCLDCQGGGRCPSCGGRGMMPKE